MNTLHFIVNPQSKNGYGEHIWKVVKAELERRRVRYQIYFTQYPGHASAIAEEIAKGSIGETVVVAVGGDGTIHEIINGIIHYSSIKLGIIPCGSGNDFARGYRIPNEPLLALKQIIEHEQKKREYIDIGKVRFNHGGKEIFFANNMGAGFDAEVASGANKSKLKLLFNRFSLGGLVYGLILIKKLFSFKCSRIDINIDGEQYSFPSTWFITIANQPFYGGGMIIAPEAIATDGELNIVIVNQLSKIKLLAVFVSVFWGGHVKFKEVTLLSGKKISISSSHSLLVHADGEICGNTPLELEVIPKALSIISMSKQSLQT
ncbi:diacylglycerol kinase family lipid kinase [Bacillus sp. DNRA2]|uniref:diacylglycerol/lipid kinase family protein n=1 Tax=Bacillus sp. DNRA2 TaxID=2723053 RepID=UPI00145C6D16|nr:diacylglycerol kinase family protein [Bacillus sp. DNRA2]NMD72737.1 diacylglycerol kinase family lipid kinase [Bacillus sp. DNRA2]